MDARAYVVAALFAFAGGMLVPRTGPDRKAVMVALALTTAVGVVAWLLSDDRFAGPSLTVGGITALIGILVTRQPDADPKPRTPRNQKGDRGDLHSFAD